MRVYPGIQREAVRFISSVARQRYRPGALAKTIVEHHIIGTQFRAFGIEKTSFQLSFVTNPATAK
jgi:hypothetical protein